MANILVVKETTLTVEKKPPVLFLPYLPSIYLETRAKLKKSLKSILKYCQVKVLFKNNPRLGNSFYLKDWIPNNITCGAGYKFESVRHLNVRTGKQTDISPLPKKQVKPKNRSAASHSLFCNHSESCESFTILTCEIKKVLLEVKGCVNDERWTILNRKITSAPFSLFERL